LGDLINNFITLNEVVFSKFISKQIHLFYYSETALVKYMCVLVHTAVTSTVSEDVNHTLLVGHGHMGRHGHMAHCLVIH